MPIQTENLVMLALGIMDDFPPNSLQPPLKDGVHLRWAFDRERGFPWHGYFLFRRIHQGGRPLCLGPRFRKEVKPGRSLGLQMVLPEGTFSSDRPLAFTESFLPAAQPEFDLRKRRHLRFELPATETAREFHAKIGFLGDGEKPLTETIKQCAEFNPREAGSVPNPYLRSKFEFESQDIRGRRTGENRIEILGNAPGLLCTGILQIKLPAASVSVELTILVSGSRDGALAEVLALDSDEKAVIDKAVISGETDKLQTITLSGKSISSIRIAGSEKGFHLRRVCYTTETVKPPKPGDITLRGFHGQVPVATTKLSGTAGEVVTAVVSADVMTSIEIEGGSAVLIDLCIASGSQGLANGWEPLLNTPLCLPVAEPGYPCVGKPLTLSLAETMALGRIHYGIPPFSSSWGGQNFTYMHQVLQDLVQGGPAAGPMASRVAAYAVTPPIDPEDFPPQMPLQSPLDMLLLGSLHPAVAMMLGLYWVDETAVLGTAYDYMIIADHDGSFRGSPGAALAALAEATPQAPLADDVDVWTTYNKKREKAPPLAPPAAPQVFALPGALTGPTDTPDARNMAGLRWQLNAAPDGALLPGEPIGYHLWRSDLGASAPTAPPPDTSYQLLTKDRLIMASESSVPPAMTAKRASDWPPFPLMKFDRGLVDGWYSYRLSAVDIWGRHSAMSGPGPWQQWQWPAPTPTNPVPPKPWYYVEPPADREVNAFAVCLLDKTPPPRPPAVEATALDPLDSMLLQDTAYLAWSGANWWDNLTPTVQGERLGLRVKWAWTIDQWTQAPDTTEFRIYFHPGSEPPAGDYTDSLNWSERIYVVGYHEHSTIVNDAQGNPAARLYDVLLPVAGGPLFGGVLLAPSETEPVVYAHVSVSAADDKTHTPDAPQWASGSFGGRTGNEGRVGTPAKIYRVLRAAPPAPGPMDTSDKVWATRADYHSRSFYTFRWLKSGTYKAHIFRALDDTLFQTDWARRGQSSPTSLDPTDIDSFPIPSWTQATRDAVAAEINGLPVNPNNADFTDTIRTAYEALSDQAMRTLAGLSGNEKAFQQLTHEPLDPADAINADRRGPDGNATYIPDPNRRAYTAQLDGRARNRYFFRAAYVNAAGTEGPFSLSSPPVYLPKVEPPRAPVIIKATGEHLRATVAWTTDNTETTGTVHIYRAESERQVRDIRLMTLVATLPPTVGGGNNAVLTEWSDDGLPGAQTYHYRITLTDAHGNVSPPSPSISVFVPDEMPPSLFWKDQEWMIQDTASAALLAWPSDGVVPTGFRPALRLRWESAAKDPAFLLSRRSSTALGWHLASSGVGNEFATPQANQFVFLDVEVSPRDDLEYRILVSNSSGLWSRDFATLRIMPPLPSMT